MTIEAADIVTRVGERLSLIAEGATLSSFDRVTIERAIDDAYNALRTELRLTWTLDDIPAESVMWFSICVASLAAVPCEAPNAQAHEAKWEMAENKLRIINRLTPDNSIAVQAEHY